MNLLFQVDVYVSVCMWEQNEFYNGICQAVWETLFWWVYLYLQYWEVKYYISWNPFCKDSRCDVGLGKQLYMEGAPALPWQLFLLASLVVDSGGPSRAQQDSQVLRGRWRQMQWGSGVSSKRGSFGIMVMSILDPRTSWFWITQHNESSSSVLWLGSTVEAQSQVNFLDPHMIQ